MIHQENTMSEEILSATFDAVKLEPGLIPSEWLLSGRPETRSKLLGRSRDRLAYIMLWECGAVSYKWHYNCDEAYIVLSGEGFMTNEKGVESRYGPGDVAFFPAGTDATWRHPDHFRKVAVLKDPVWPPLAFVQKALMKISRTFGVSRKPGF
jgi:uncharacterized cupin superfamily protein